MKKILKKFAFFIAGNLAVPIWVIVLSFSVGYVLVGVYQSMRHAGKSVELPLLNDYEAASEKLKKALQESATTPEMTTEIDVYSPTIFSTETVRITATRRKNNPNGPFDFGPEIKTFVENSYRFESAGFVFAAGVWILGLYLINWGIGAVRNLLLSFSMSDENTASIKENGLSELTQYSYINGNNQKPLSAKDALSRDVEYGRVSATRAQLQAAILVVSGVAMALLGVVVFYYSLAPLSEIRFLEASERVDIMILGSIRPAFVLFFIEGVAWFLLRQYRMQTIDFKDHLDRVAARTNVLACIEIAEKIDSIEMRKELIAMLLKEKEDTPLKLGESTVALENEKISNTNPLWQIAEALVKKIPDASAK